MQKILIILILFSIKGYSQVLDSKDSCVLENVTRIFKYSNLPLRSNFNIGDVVMITDQKDFESKFKKGNSHKRDSIISVIDFNKNNIIVFSLPFGGCQYPEIEGEYCGNIIQIKLKQKGKCSMYILASGYILIPKEITGITKVRICKNYAE